jgi:hypothetical protein
LEGRRAGGGDAAGRREEDGRATVAWRVRWRREFGGRMIGGGRREDGRGRGAAGSGGGRRVWGGGSERQTHGRRRQIHGSVKKRRPSFYLHFILFGSRDFDII